MPWLRKRRTLAYDARSTSTEKVESGATLTASGRDSRRCARTPRCSTARARGGFRAARWSRRRAPAPWPSWPAPGRHATERRRAGHARRAGCRAAARCASARLAAPFAVTTSSSVVADGASATSTRTVSPARSTGSAATARSRCVARAASRDRAVRRARR